MLWTQIIAEHRIIEAMENGEFDDLPGKGRPLDLAEYFSTPVADRMACSLLKSAGVLPPEMQLLKEIQELEKALNESRDPRRRAQLRQQIEAKRVSAAMSLERRRQSARCDSGLEPGVF